MAWVTRMVPGFAEMMIDRMMNARAHVQKPGRAALGSSSTCFMDNGIVHLCWTIDLLRLGVLFIILVQNFFVLICTNTMKFR
jgi:hypothetical protein